MFATLKNRSRDLLLWTQKYTRTDMLYLAKGGSWLVFGDSISSIIAFLSAIAFANFLPQDVYGSYKYILSIAGILSIASLTGVGAAVTRAVAQGFEGSMLPAIRTKIRWALLGSFGALLIAIYYFLHGNGMLGTAFIIVAAFVPLVDSFSLYSAYLEGKKQFPRSARFQIYGRIISAGALIVTIYLTNNLFLVLLSYFTPQALTSYVFYRLVRREIAQNSAVSTSASTFGKHLSFIGALKIIGEQLDKILLWNFLGAIQVAVYAFALAPVNQMLGMIKNILPLALPKLAERSREELRRTLPYKLLIMTSIIAVPVFAYILAAPFLFKLVFPQYLSSVAYSQVFALSLLLIPRNIISDALVAHGETKKIYTLSIANSALKFPLVIVLVSFFGIWGAIYSYLISGLFSFALAIFLFWRKS